MRALRHICCEKILVSEMSCAVRKSMSSYSEIQIIVISEHFLYESIDHKNGLKHLPLYINR
jgi:hypothetical protein